MIAFQPANKQIVSLKNRKESDNLENREKMFGFKILDWHGFKGDKRQLYNNCVEPEDALHIFKCAFKEKQCSL